MKPKTSEGQPNPKGIGRRRDGQVKWLQWVFILAAIVAVIPVSLYLILWRAGETASLEHIAARQLAQQGLYGTSIHDDTAHYKLALYEAVKPDVIAIGSSRVMQFRGEAFSRSFVNLGGTVKGLTHAVELLPHLFESHQPKVILFGVDFWWFNADRKPRSSWLERPAGRGVSARTLLHPIEWLVEGKVTLTDLSRVVQEGDPKHFGLQAILRRDGFDQFGSYHYSSTITGRKSHFDAKFSLILERVREGKHRFEWGDRVLEERWDRFLSVLEIADEAGIPVVLLLPPVAPTIADEMTAQGKYGLLDDLKSRLSGLDRPYFDFHDTRSLGAGDCAFIDGDHGGDILYAVMAARMETQTPAIALDWVNEALVQDIVESNPQSATAKQWRYSELPEVDFLEIGCR